MEVRNGLEALSSRYSTRYLQIAGNSLERAIKFAQAHERVARNVAELIEAPGGKIGRPSKSLTLAQAQAMLTAAAGERLYLYVVVSLLSGIRTEQIRALCWERTGGIGSSMYCVPIGLAATQRRPGRGDPARPVRRGIAPAEGPAGPGPPDRGRPLVGERARVRLGRRHATPGG
jgi:hypothetical protein